jgi:hypothetical protein
MEAINREKEAFEKMKAQLLHDPEYAGKYVAVLGGNVIDSDANLLSLAQRVYRTHGYQPIYMGLVTDKPATRRVIESSEFPI